MRPVTFAEAEKKRLKAVQFLGDVVGDQDKADEFDAMSTGEYIEHRGLRIANPTRRKPMALTKSQLEARLREMHEENEALQEQLDAVADIVSPEDDDDETDEDEDEENEDEDEDEDPN